jgi:hypothetical protein
MRRGEAASGRLKALLSLALLAASIYAAFRIFPAYLNNYQLQDHIRQLSAQLAVRPTPATPDEVTNEVVQFAQDHGIPLAPENIVVTIGHHVKIDLDYTVPVDLSVYTLRLHFTPSADSVSL